MWDARAEAERWRRQAANDLAFARVALREEFHAQACFIAQQASEKAVKAVAYGLGERTVIGHSLVTPHLAIRRPGTRAGRAARARRRARPVLRADPLPERAGRGRAVRGIRRGAGGGRGRRGRSLRAACGAPGATPPIAMPGGAAKISTPFLTAGAPPGRVACRMSSEATAPSVWPRCRASCRTAARASADRFRVVRMNRLPCVTDRVDVKHHAPNITRNGVDAPRDR